MVFCVEKGMFSIWYEGLWVLPPGVPVCTSDSTTGKRCMYRFTLSQTAFLNRCVENNFAIKKAYQLLVSRKLISLQKKMAPRSKKVKNYLKAFVFKGSPLTYLCRFCTFLNSAQVASWAKFKNVQNLHKSKVIP